MMLPDMVLHLYLGERADPEHVYIVYSAFRPEGLPEPAFTVLLNGHPVSLVQGGPPYPWTPLRVNVSSVDGDAGDFRLQITGDPVASNKKTFGVVLSRISVKCRSGPCLQGWTVTREGR